MGRTGFAAGFEVVDVTACTTQIDVQGWEAIGGGDNGDLTCQGAANGFVTSATSANLFSGAGEGIVVRMRASREPIGQSTSYTN